MNDFKKKIIWLSDHLRREWQIYVLLAPTIIWFLFFLYKPMYGLQIAFKDYSIFKGIAGSPWIGFEHFQTLFESDQFVRAVWNTVTISALSLVFGFPAPIILALLFNEILHHTYKKTAQTIVYLPHFVSTVIIAGIVITAFSPSAGIVNTMLRWFGVEPIYFLTKPEWFRPIFIGSGIWQEAGFQSIVFLHPYAGEGYREGIKNLAQWYAEKLIDAEIFTRGSSSREYLLSENLGGMTHDWFASTSGYNTSLQGKVKGFAFKAFAPPASISGKRIEEHRRIPIKPDGWAIGGMNKHPVETIKYFDFWFSPEGRRLANFGVEGLQYNLVDGKPQFTEEMLTNGQPVNNQLYSVGAQLQGRGYFQDYEYERQWSNKYALEGIALYDKGDYLIDQFLGVAFNPDEQKVYDRYWPSIRDYMLERQQSWILGNGNVEADWNSYITQLNKMGLDDVLAVMQSAYDRQYGG